MNNLDIDSRQGLAPGTRVGNYVIKRLLNDGKGGCGLLYLACREKGGDVVEYVLKELYPTKWYYRIVETNKIKVAAPSWEAEEYVNLMKKSFDAECEIYESLSGCLHIPHFIDKFDANNTHYFVMEYVNAPKIDTKSSEMTKNDLLFVLDYIADALDYIHKKFILHLDISPNNILFANNDFSGSVNCWLIDFGAAVLFTKDDIMADREKNTSGLITRGFSDPLLCDSGKRKITFKPQLDLYSLGKVVESVVNKSNQMSNADKEFFYPFIDACTNPNIDFRPGSVNEAMNLLMSPLNFSYGFIPVSYNSTSNKFSVNLAGEDYFFDQIRQFHDGYAAVCDNGKWGLINDQGIYVLRCEYEYVTDVFHGFVNVCKNKVWQTFKISSKGIIHM